MNLQKFFEAIIQNGGASYSITSGELNPNFGYFVSASKNDFRVPFNQFHKQIIIDFVYKNAIALSEENCFLGGWISNNQVVLDVVDHIEDRRRALYQGMTNNKEAIFNANIGEDINLPISRQTSGTITQQQSYITAVIDKLMTSDTY